MINERFTELITKELIGELEPAEEQELQLLIKSNSFYAKQRDKLKMYWANDIASITDSKALFQTIVSKIKEQEPDFNTAKVIPLKNKLLSLTWKVAVIILVIGSSVFLYNNNEHNKQDNLGNTNIVVTKTLLGERKELTLPDGTKVTMNADSKLSFPSIFSDSTREVSLTGEAFFDVHEDHSHPFIIHTRKMDIRVLGTAFNVKAYQNDKFSETTLIRGSIQVKLLDRPSDRITLKPTEKLIVNYSAPVVKDDTKSASVKPNALPEITYLHKLDTTVVETSWLQNKLLFNDQDFESLANNLERRYDVNIQLESDVIKQLRFTGMFEKETIAEVLKALQLTENFNYKILKDKILIY